MEIHFEETVGIANSISNEAQVVRELESWLNNCVDVTLPSAWKGQGYEGYVDRVKSLKPTFDAMYELIIEMGNGLKNNAAQYEKMDKEIAAQNRK